MSSLSPIFFLLKTAALFHDPPDKAWCFKREESHEKWAEELAKIALTGTSLENAVNLLFDDRVRNADRLAASIDRRILGLITGNKRGALHEKTIKLKNPIDPRIEIDLSDRDVQKEKVEEVMKKLNTILKKIEDPRDAYLALYGLYELIWIHEGLPSGPADTRIPTHTIFDHLYATASALNWTYEEGGFLLHLDVAGIQDFIAKSRKLRDLWASSYIASALLWSTVLDFIKLYGPDVILIPTCRFNFFFYYDLMNRISEIKEDLGEMLNIIYKGWTFPRFAIVPASMMLLLPSLEKDPESLIKENFRKKWKQFCGSILSSSEPDIQLLVKKLQENMEYGFVENPPLMIRASSVKISSTDALAYNGAYNEVMKKNRMKKQLKEDPACTLPLTKITMEIFDGKRKPLAERGFDYCTMCGKLPSIIKGESLGVFLGEGEKLCPYCLMKRIFSFKPEIALKEMLGYGDDVKIEKYPSLADFSTFDFRDSILSNLSKLNELWKDGEVRKLLEEAMKSLKEDKLHKSQWRYQEKKFEDLGKFDIDIGLRSLLINFLFTESEDTVLERKDLWNQVRGKLQEKGLSVSPINTYYALIRADGDNMGRIMGGDLSALEMEVEDYIKNLFEGKSKEIVSKILENDINSAKKIAEEEKLDEKNIDNLNKFIDEIRHKKKLPVSISYHVSISRALMIAAINDIEIVEKNNGVVIYAGGDDLLSIAPVSSAVEIVDESRLKYGGFVREAHGYRAIRFHKFNNYYVPSMGNTGRSYSLYIAHYRYPLHDVMRDSLLKLEEIAKESAWVYEGEEKKKDSFVITYSARGPVESSVLPLSVKKPELTLPDITLFLNNVINMILSGEISTALLYETSRGSFIRTAERAWRMKEKDVFEKLIRYLVRRHLQKEEKEEILNKIMGIIKENEDIKRHDLREETKESPLFMEIFKSCRLLYGGLRGD